MDTVVPTQLRFEGFTLDLARCSLSRGAEQLQLRPKAFDLLRYLAQNAGRVVTKDELMAAIWPGLVVTDDSLVQCVKDIREALDDRDQRIIRTVPRRGYLFAAEVAALEADDQRPRSVSPRPWPWPWLAAAGALVLLAVVAVHQRYEAALRDQPAAEALAERASIAVLPLVSLGDPESSDYFADGLTEDVIAALGRFPGISVRSRNAVLPYKGSTPRPEDVSRALNVRYVVEGSVRRSRERVRVSVQLTDASRNAVLWSLQYDTEPREIFAVQDQITRRIAGTLAVRLDRLELARTAAKPPERLEAYDLVLRARHELARATRIGNAHARSLFESALELDPAYVPAIVGLGLVDLDAVRFGWTSDARAALERAEALGRKAVAADDSYPAAHALLGRVYIRYGDLDRALDAIRRAVSLNASDPDTHAALGNALLLSGDIAGAIDAIERATEYEPDISPTDYFRLGMAYILAGRASDAVRALERGVARNEKNAIMQAMLAAAYAQAGRHDDAERRASAVRKLVPVFPTSELGSLFRNPEHREKILEALRKAGL